MSLEQALEANTQALLNHSELMKQFIAAAAHVDVNEALKVEKPVLEDFSEPKHDDHDVYTEADVRDAIIARSKKFGRESAVEILASFGTKAKPVKRLPDLMAEHYAEAIKLLNAEDNNPTRAVA